MNPPNPSALPTRWAPVRKASGPLPLTGVQEINTVPCKESPFVLVLVIIIELFIVTKNSRLFVKMHER